jgi:gamma-tubulin complex component 4
MHKELLFALFGFEGNIFVRDKDSGIMKVVDGLPGIHPSELNLLNAICKLGGFYKDFEDFITEQNRPLCLLGREPGRSVPEVRGFYLKALANGLNEVLEDYRRCVLRLEEKVTQNPHLPVTQIKHDLEEYQLLFPALQHMLDTIHKQKLCGGQVLSLLDERKNCGIPSVENVMNKLLFSCHCVFYRQLSAWVLYGIIEDICGEFLVQEVVEKDGDSPSVGGEEEVEDSKQEVSQATGKEAGQKKVSFKEQKMTSKVKQEDREQTPQTVTYTIRQEMLPSYLPVRVAEKILFIGESVKMFNRESSAQKVDPWTKGREQHKGKTSVLARKDAATFATMLTELQRKPLFSIWDFEAVVDKIREHVSENLWKLVVEDSDLVGHLQTIKDFYLLGRGELFLSFMDLAQAVLRRPVVDTTLHDVNAAFRQSLVQVGMESEDIMDHFKLSLTPNTSEGGAKRGTDGEGRSGWAALGMVYTPPWPLHILFTTSILEKYNVLFTFLLSVRRAQTNLQQVWHLLMLRKNEVNVVSSLWQLRNHMAFLIDNVQYYVQVDVLESQFSLLLQNITSTLDFESIKLAHERFVTTLQGQLFLLMPPVSSCLTEILDICTSFCAVVHSTQLSFTDRDKSQISLLARDFDRQSSLLLRLLTSMKNHQHSPHLAQMMLRVDYNKFFSTGGLVIPFADSLPKDVP